MIEAKTESRELSTLRPLMADELDAVSGGYMGLSWIGVYVAIAYGLGYLAGRANC